MPKHFVVQLEKADGTVVANSQIITVAGLGNGNIVAADFVDGSLYGAVRTNSRSAVFYKTLASRSGGTTGSSIFTSYYFSDCGNCDNPSLFRVSNLVAKI